MTAHEMHFIERPADGDPDGAFFLFHGRGTDEHDLFPLFDVFDPDRRLLGICPRGVLQLPPVGWHWYVVERVGYPHKETFEKTFGIVAPWMDGFLSKKGIPFERTVIGGFSQGAVMSYALSLHTGRPQPAGILAMSGFIPTVDGFEIDLKDRSGLAVAIAHGTYDPVISVEFGRDARARLEAAHADVLYRESPVDHTIDPRVVPELVTWLKNVIDGFSD
jgi:phospholipase/carboxylesterase